MTTREFIQHLILNGELDDEVLFEIALPEAMVGKRFYELYPAHVMHLNDSPNVTVIDCKVRPEEDT